MYKVVIIDDEEIMREGLMNLVNWESMGFEVTADFEDGQEAFEYLKGNQVDVLLTDIKMTFVSGLDLARYINEQELPTKVVLISGYKDFEYAREAVNYNVVQYLLKPISLKDIKKVFEGIRSEMDKKKESLKRQQDRQKKYNELLSVMQDQFFTDLVLGALRDSVEMNKRLEILDMGLDPRSSPCCLFTATIDSYEEYIDKNWDYGLDAFHKAIANVFCAVKRDLKFQFINGREGRFKMLIIGPPHLSRKDFMQRVEFDMKKAKENARKLLGIELAGNHGDFYENLYILAAHTDTLKATKIEPTDDNSIGINLETQEYLLDQQKLLMTHVFSGNREPAFSLMGQILKEITPLGTKKIEEFLVNFFNTLVNQLQKNGINISEAMKSEWTDFDNLNLNTSEGDRQILLMRLDNIMQQARDDEKHSDSTIISHIKGYIHGNYNQDITLEQVADHVFLSPVYLSRLFKEKTGENFSDYLIQIRMKKALELLKNPRYKVYEVGYNIGYKSTKYFYKLFKQHYGCTPTEYRKNLCVGGER